MSDEPLGLADLGYPTADTVRRAQAYHDILVDFIAGMRAAAEMNPGSAHSRYILAACAHSETRLREVTGDA